jgi:cell division protein FtsZ
MLPPARHPEARPARPIAEYARPAAPQRLDPFGRAAPARNPAEEKILDIPAFLSRKAN